MGTLTKAMAPNILEDRGGVTMGDCQVRLAICVGLGRAGSSVVRVLWAEDGRPIRVCSACREAQESSGAWQLQQRPRRVWAGPGF
jgi:hypothetical protein